MNFWNRTFHVIKNFIKKKKIVNKIETQLCYAKKTTYQDMMLKEQMFFKGFSR